MNILYSRSYNALFDALYEQIEGILRHGRQGIVIVPAQVSFLIESGILRRLRLPGFMDVEVMSFEKLVSRVSELEGGRALPVLDKASYAMLAKLALSEEKELAVLKDGADMHEQLAAMVFAMKGEHVRPEDLLNLSQNFSGYFKDKLIDIARLYARMQAAAGSLYDSADFERYAAGLFSGSAYLKEKEALVFGFDVLPAARMDTLTALAAAARDCTLFFQAGEGAEFQKQRQSLLKLERALGALPREIIREEAAPEAQHIARYFYEYPYEKFPRVPQNLFIAKASSKKKEVEYAAGVILKNREGRRFSDFSLCMADPREYALLLEEVFFKAGIPYFLENKRPVMKSGAAALVLSALDIVIRGRWRRADVFRYLKSGFPCPDAQADEIISRAKEYGLKGYRFKAEGDQSEDVRAVFQPLYLLEEGVRAGEAPGKLLQELLSHLNVEKRLEEQAKAAAEAGFHAESRYLSQLYEAILDLIRKTDILQNASLEQVRDVLEAGFQSTRLSVIPPGHDEVAVFDVTHSIDERREFTLILGVNEGVLPLPLSPGGLITAGETAELRRLLPGFPGLMEFEDQRAYIKNCLLRGQKLYLTYREEQPSHIIERLHSLFPALLEEDADALPLPSAEASFGALIKELSGALAGGEPGALTASYLAGAPRLLDEAAAAFLRDRQPALLDPPVAKELYYLNNTSVSRIESFYSCSYRHYLDYGLRPREVPEFEEDAMNAGSYVHALLEGFTEEVQKKGRSWQDYSDGEIDETMARVAEGQIEGHNRAIFQNKRFAFTEKRLRAEAALAARAVREQLQGTEVSVAAGEAAFSGSVMELETSFGKVSVRGKIDRVDKVEKGGVSLLRVVDYKTGDEKFSRAEAEMGLSIQLITYLMAAESYYKKAGNALGVGGFYFSVALPLLSEEKEDKRYEGFRMNGFILASYDEARAFDSVDEGQMESMNAELNKAAREVKGKETFRREDMKELFAFVRGLIQSAVEKMAGGELRVNPAKRKGQLPCRYCTYRAICMYEEGRGEEQTDETDA